MSQNTNGTTRLGTEAPVTESRPGAGVDPERPRSMPGHSDPIPLTGLPTIGMRRRPESAVQAPIAGDPEVFVGQELGGYTIRRRLAEGGMGVVYEAVHDKIGRAAAIKVLRLEFCRSEDMVERFYQEARAVNAIRHDNIVDVYDFGRDSHGRVYFVMEYLEGEPLSARIKRGALVWAEAFPILEQTLRALKAAHDKGFVHRDLKPDNIWLRPVDGRVQVKLLDFGIAKLVGVDDARERLTQTGSMIGTPHYMSPEQINGSRDIDRRTDVYALGAIMHEMFTGAAPFVGDTVQAIMSGHLFREPPRLTGLPASLGVPAEIAEIVDLMLAKDAAGRYQSATDLLADLHDVHNHRLPANAATLTSVRDTRARTVVPPTAISPPRPHPRSRGALAVRALAVAAIVAGVAIAVSRRQQPEPPPPRPIDVIAPRDERPKEPRPPDEPDYDAVRKAAQVTLRASLRESEPVVRVHGSDALGKIKDQPSTRALAELTERDPDVEVRGHAANALGVLGASSEARLLARLETAAPPPLKVWYASALARLGDKPALKRLLDYARSTDLAVSFKAGLTLADLSKPGDKKTIAALKALAAHEAALNSVEPYAGALILTRMAALRDPGARKLLYGTLEHTDEGARLAAAEGLSKLGDDAGRKVLADVFANQASPNRLVAAVAQIPLGEYGGLDLITGQLAAKDPGTRRLAARALGDIGERKSLRALIDLTRDADWTVRVAAAAAIVAIVGLDPQVLARASVDWTAGALASEDWAMRKAAAGVLADIPENQAVPLLAQAIADRDPKVRLAASRSARKMKSADAATRVAVAAKAETDPGVKEQQVKALGEIGHPTARDTLAEISEEPGRIGVLAAGSLIAVGDASAKAKLDAAVAATEVDLRLAAVEAASAAKNPVVVATLKIGVLDRVFTVRFTAAEGLAGFNAEKTAAVPVLTQGLDSRDADVVGRALAALTRLGEKVNDKAQTPSEMLESPDARLRLAAVPVVRALPVAEAVPLLRRLIADPDPDVRHAGVDAIEDIAAKDKDEAVKLYKPLVSHVDPVVRSKASGQLSQLVPPPPAPPQPAAPDPAPAVDPALPKVKIALDDTTAASREAKVADEAFEAVAADLATAIAAPPRDDSATKRVEDLATGLADAAARLEGQAGKVEAAAQAAADAAGASPSPDAAKLVAEAQTLAHGAREAATSARGKATDAADKARGYLKAWTGDFQLFISSGNAATAAGNFTDAQRNLDKAARLLQKIGAKNSSLDYAYALLYDKMAGHAQDPAAKRKLWQQAQDAYRKVAKTGAGPLVQRSNDRVTEIAEELKELGAP
jgi:serine/threonine protein kinase/HEAT repeat protein